MRGKSMNIKGKPFNTEFRQLQSEQMFTIHITEHCSWMTTTLTLYSVLSGSNLSPNWLLWLAFHGFPHFFQEDARQVSLIRFQLIPSKYFSFNYSIIIVSVDVTLSQVLIASLNKPMQIKINSMVIPKSPSWYSNHWDATIMNRISYLFRFSVTMYQIMKNLTHSSKFN
jgi:hypothetical protein